MLSLSFVQQNLSVVHITQKTHENYQFRTLDQNTMYIFNYKFKHEKKREIISEN